MQGDEFDKVFNKEKLKITLAQEKIPNEIQKYISFIKYIKEIYYRNCN